MRLPWVSRELYEMALQQIEDLKAANAKLLDLALTKDLTPQKPEEEEEMATRPRRRLVAQLRDIAEQEMREKHEKNLAAKAQAKRAS